MPGRSWITCGMLRGRVGAGEKGFVPGLVAERLGALERRPGERGRCFRTRALRPVHEEPGQGPGHEDSGLPGR